MTKTVKEKPEVITNQEYRFDAFNNNNVLLQKKKGHLPAMGWNSWNAFGSGNTEALTKAMADKMIELGLDQLGYQYLVLDDGCYMPERVDGKLANETLKFPGGFKALADYIHAKGLKFGMYNDIGTNLCAGAAVGTCGHEMDDAKSYIDWDVDFLKVDNCYYLWDNATFSDATNAKFVYAPNIRSMRVKGEGTEISLQAVKDGVLTGNGAAVKNDYVTGIGTFDGTGPDQTPVGEESSELCFIIDVPKKGEYQLYITYATGQEPGVGSWIQVAVGKDEDARVYYDDFLPITDSVECFQESQPITVTLLAGENCVRLMNHRRQENTLLSYATLLEGLNLAKPDHDVIFSICEWGKTQPQNWGYKVGDSWRILNDITFRVGSDGDPGTGTWTDDYTASVTSQYSKAVIMDEFAGLDKGWNDPDMLMIGMNGLSHVMNKTHMAMWCMMNAPLMLGLDLRRVKKGDDIWQIIANEKLIAINQDALGIQAKRVYSSKMEKSPDMEYIRDMDRVDILAKPLADGSIAVSFINVSGTDKAETYQITKKEILTRIGHKMVDVDRFKCAESYQICDVWTGESAENSDGVFTVSNIEAYDNYTYIITPLV